MKKGIGYLEFFKDLLQSAYAEGHFHDPYNDVSCHCQHGCECRNKGIERCYRLVMESLDWLLKKKKEQDKIESQAKKLPARPKSKRRR